jgi:hypothetical protein
MIHGICDYDVLKIKQFLIFYIFIVVDYNRVILEPEEGVPDSDYINASYVDVSKSPCS